MKQDIKKIAKKLEKDEFGLYIQASNYIECRVNAIISKAIYKPSSPSLNYETR